MAIQRSKLANKLGQRLLFSATVGEFTHKRIKAGGKKPVYLLKDLSIVNKAGQIIESDLADHVWVEANEDFFKLEHELMPEDVIMFMATVGTYGIKQSDVIAQRDEIGQAAQKQKQQTFQNYREDYLDWKDEWQNVLQANQRAKKDFHKGLIDRRQLQTIESKNINTYRNDEPNGVRTKQQETDIIKQAKRQQHKHKLIDYQLLEISQIKFVKEKRLHQGWQRLKVSTKDFKNQKFLNYLAARSFAYRDQVPYDVFARKKS